MAIHVHLEPDITRPQARPGLRLACLCSLVLLGACANTIGPSALVSGRRGYNEAIQVAANEQLLTNIVRLRYDEMPFFLDIRQINTTYKNITAINAGLNAEQPFSASKLAMSDHYLLKWGFGARWQFEEVPTITYIPLQGQKFATEYLSPISQGILTKLYYSGWSIDRILRLCVQEMAGIKNAPSATGPAPRKAPEYKQFRKICTILKNMQDRGLLHLTISKQAGEPVAVLEFEVDPNDADKGLDTQLRDMLGLPEESRHLILTRHIATNPSEVTITPRSVMGILFYVSQGVGVSEVDIKKGRVVVTKNRDGSTFDWDEVLGDLFKVRVGTNPAEDALVVTRRGRYFYYIPADDIESKRTFHFISQLVTLVGGKFDSPAPVLTVPVTR